MNSLQTNYQALPDENEAPSDSFVIHVASEGGKSRWNHVVDLDAFFRNIYTFHQKHGLTCILVERILWILLYVFISFGVIYAVNCIHFNFDAVPSLFVNTTDTDLSALFVPVSVCAAQFGFLTWLLIVLFIVILVIALYRSGCKVFKFKEIQHFFESAMKISRKDIHNVTWHDVQCKLREVQHEQQMCVHKSDLTELDIYHRILRYKNYMVAMVNKNILPLKYNVKFFGEWIYFSSALEFCIQLLFFDSPLSPFQGTGTLKEEYKKYNKRSDVAAELAKQIYLLGIFNVISIPFIFCWRLFSFCLAYSGLLRFDPAFVGIRRWSSFARLYLRHFNELDHELDARLGRAFRPADEYTKSFSSPVSIVIYKFLRQIVGFVVVFFTLWGVYTERLFLFSHVLLIISVGAITFTALSGLIPNENQIYFPNLLMQKIISDTHYAPEHFKTMAHTTIVRDEFCHLFQYNLVYLLEELFSPIVTPYILIFHLRPRALDIVDFLRNFTVEVTGVGDVCSFALMDVSKHGNQEWVQPVLTKADQYQQAEGGKTELSLLHFTMMNPHWEPPPASNAFIQDFKNQVNAAKQQSLLDNPFYSSLNSLSTMGSRYASLVMQQSLHPSTGVSISTHDMNIGASQHASQFHMRGGMSRAEGPPYIQDTILSSITDEEGHFSLNSNCNPMEIRTAEMSLSALFLREVHEKQMEDTRTQKDIRRQSGPSALSPEDEESPLLEMPRSNYVQ